MKRVVMLGTSAVAWIARFCLEHNSTYEAVASSRTAITRQRTPPI